MKSLANENTKSLKSSERNDVISANKTCNIKRDASMCLLIPLSVRVLSNQTIVQEYAATVTVGSRNTTEASILYPVLYL